MHDFRINAVANAMLSLLSKRIRGEDVMVREFDLTQIFRFTYI